MRLTSDRKTLAGAFASAAGASKPNSPLTQLQKVLVRADETGVTVTGTDNEMSFSCLVSGCEVDEPGECLLMASEASNLLSKWGDGRVSLEASDTSVLLSGFSDEFEFQVEDPARFPTVRGFDSSDYHIIAAADMKRLIARTIHSVGTHNGYAIAGVLAEPMDGAMRFTATDGNRGSRQVVPAGREGDPVHPKAVVSIPAKTLKLLNNHLSDDDPPVHFACDEKSARFRTETAVVWSTLHSGNFPKLDHAIPATVNHRVTVGARALLGAIERAGLVTDVESKALTFRFDHDVVGLQISGGSQKGRSRVQVPTRYEGNGGVQTRFDPSRLAPALKALGEDAEVVIEIESPTSNIVIRCGDDYLLMVSTRCDPN